MTEEDFRTVSNLLYRLTGICLDQSSRQIVESRLSRHFRDSHAGTFSEFIEGTLLRNGQVGASLLISALTTNTTRFFREPAHFEIFSRDVVPQISRRARKGERVRIWSAACSSGEEPFSIGAVLLRDFPEVCEYDVKILATDVDRLVLEKGKVGRYRAQSFSGIDQNLSRYLVKDCGDGINELELNDDLRKLVTFRYLNFVEPWPVSGPFDAIFCRNAAIYMDPEVQARLWIGLEKVLSPDGCLFIGHSERLTSEVAIHFDSIGRTAFKRRKATLQTGKGNSVCL